MSKDNASARSALEILGTLGVLEDCVRLMKAIEEAIKACKQIEGQDLKNFGKKMLWPFKEKETKYTMAQLGRLREALSVVVVVDSSKMLQNIENVTKSIDENVIEAL